MVGAHDGIAWLTYPGGFLPPATVEPVLVTGNTLVGCARGVHVRSENGNAKGTLRHNRYWQTPIGVEAENATATSIDWWGCNGGPDAVGCAASAITAGGALDAASWLALGLEALPGSAEVGELVPVTATLRETLGGVVALSFPPTSILFGATPAGVTSPHDTANGAALAAYTPVAAGLATLSATLDSTTVQAQLLVTQGGIVTVGSVAETGVDADRDRQRLHAHQQHAAGGRRRRHGAPGRAPSTGRRRNAAPPGRSAPTASRPPATTAASSLRSGSRTSPWTRATLGDAVIQGPGDLPAVNLEGFLGDVGRHLQGLDHRPPRHPRLRPRHRHVLPTAAPTPATSSTASQVIDNRIELPADLNAIAAPADVNQNIGIHFAFGDHQTIQGNEIVIPGTGVSDTSAPDRPTGRYASSVGMQSNTSGGAVYDGLLIADNLVRVTGAQSADPEQVIGIWENGHAHLANITVQRQPVRQRRTPATTRRPNRQTRLPRHLALLGDHRRCSTRATGSTGANIGWRCPTIRRRPPSRCVVRSNDLEGNGTGLLVTMPNQKVDLELQPAGRQPRRAWTPRTARCSPRTTGGAATPGRAAPAATASPSAATPRSTPTPG